MIDIRLSGEVLAHYRAYSLCCHVLLRAYEDLSAACDIDDLIEKFDEELRNSYCDEYELTIACVEYSFEKLIRNYSANSLVHHKLEAVLDEILANADVWDFEAPVAKLRDVGKGLAREFYREGERSTNIELIESEDPALTFSNACLSDSKQGGSIRNRPITFWLDEIHLPFHREFEFCHYLSYPFLFFHEYASHVYTPEMDSRTFDDGWMMYAIELYMKSRWVDLCERYPLINAQRKVLRRTWLSDFGQLAARGYELAEDVDVWIDRFLEFTWDLASYPPDFAGQLSFHHKFMEVVKKYISHDRGSELRSIAARSSNAQQLYANLAAELESP
jgi:hypothetical protein